MKTNWGRDGLAVPGEKMVVEEGREETVLH